MHHHFVLLYDDDSLTKFDILTFTFSKERFPEGAEEGSPVSFQKRKPLGENKAVENCHQA